MSDYQLVPFPPARTLVADTLMLGHRVPVMHGLIEVDVTEPRRRIAAMDPANRPSFTAYAVACIARAVQRHPRVAAFRDWRGRLVMFDDVDVATVVEIEVNGSRFPLAHVLRGAHDRSVRELTEELRSVQRDRQHHVSRARWRLLDLYPWVPGFLRRWLLDAWLASPYRRRALCGTVSVSALGMFGTGDGFGVPPPTVYSMAATVGGIQRRPTTVDGAVEHHDWLQLALSFDHTIVDGGPAARFAEGLRRSLASGALLEDFIAEPGPDPPLRLVRSPPGQTR